MSAQLKKMCEFSKDKSLSVESDYANRKEMKRIDNNSDKGFSKEFDSLNESLYKINSFLKLSKDIDDLKKENIVKNDIQRKLSLKSQWLNSNHGSAASLNSLPPTNSKNRSVHSSTQSLNKGESKKENDLSKKRKHFANFKSQSVQNVNAEWEKPRPRRLGKRSTCTSFDELDFVDKLKLSDEDVSRLSQEPDFQDKKDGFSRIDEVKNRMRSLSESRGSSVTSSQRDLSRFFPKKEVKAKPVNVNKNQKELKDVDLSKYFLPTPVQGLKSLPSPGQSPKLPRKPLNVKPNEENTPATSSLLRTAIDNLQKTKKSESEDQNQNNEPKKEDFTLRDQQMDGEVSLKKPPRLHKFNVEKVNSEAPYSGYQSIPLGNDKTRQEKDDCEKLFDCMKSPADNIDELFDKVAADTIPKLPKPKIIEKVPLKNEPPKIIRKFAEKRPIAIKKVELKSDFAPAAKWCRKETFNDDSAKREAEILSKLSSNLLNEIKLLEKHLELNDELNEKKEKEKAEKKPNKAKKDKLVNKLDADFTGTEEDLNNAIDDILNSVAFKKEIPAQSPKKLTHVILPKASKGSRSEVGPFSTVEFQTDNKTSPKQTKSKKVQNNAPKSITPFKQTNVTSKDTVDAIFDSGFKTETIQKNPSTENVTFTIRKPSIKDNSIPIPLIVNQQPQKSKFEIVPESPSENNAVTFTIRKSPVHEISKSPTVIESEATGFRPKPPIREKLNRKASFDNSNQAQPLAFGQELQKRSVEPIQRVLSTENDSVTVIIKKPSVNQLIEKLTNHENERPSIENELLSKKPTLNKKTYKVHLPSDEDVPQMQFKAYGQRAQSREKEVATVNHTLNKPNIEPKSTDFVKRTPSRERDLVAVQKNSIKDNKEMVQPILKQTDLRSPKVDKKDLVSFTATKPLEKEPTKFKTAEPAPKLTLSNAKKSFFAEFDKLSCKSDRSTDTQDEPAVEQPAKLEQNKPNSDVQPSFDSKQSKNEPPIKPVRRNRSRKSSMGDDEKPIVRKRESSPSSSNHSSVPNKSDLHLFTNNLNKLTDDLNKDEIQSQKNIAQIIDPYKKPESKVDIVEEEEFATPAASIDNIYKAVENKKTDDRRFDPPEYQEKNEHRLSGSGDYDNVPSALTIRRAKLAETRNASRSFDTSGDVDRDYDNIKNLNRRSADRLPSTVTSADRKKNVTDMLLERSKNLHDKKQEFMNDKLVETNPYIKRMMEKESRFRPGYERSRVSPLTSTSHYDYPSYSQPYSQSYSQPYSHSISRPLPSTTLASTSSHLSYNPRVTAPSSSSRGVLDMFRSPTSSNKDSCIIS